jgi:hypothetical protein
MRGLSACLPRRLQQAQQAVREQERAMEKARQLMARLDATAGHHAR